MYPGALIQIERFFPERRRSKHKFQRVIVNVKQFVSDDVLQLISSKLREKMIKHPSSRLRVYT